MSLISIVSVVVLIVYVVTVRAIRAYVHDLRLRENQANLKIKTKTKVIHLFRILKQNETD